MSHLLTAGILQQMRNVIPVNPPAGDFPSSGLVAYYKLDEASGSVIDSHSTNHGASYGVTRGLSGKIGNGYYFGVSDYVDLNAVPLLGEEMTISFWVKPDSPANYARLILQGVDCGAKPYIIYFHTNTLNFGSGVVGVGNVNPIRGAAIQNDIWSFVVCTITSSFYAEMFLNDEMRADQTYGSGAGVNGRFSLGARGVPNSPSSFFKGSIDEVGMWNRILTRQEITDLYNNGNGITL